MDAAYVTDLLALTISAVLLIQLPPVRAASPFFYSGASGTQVGPDDVLKTNSAIPHLPYYFGFMGTHGTYRFLSVMEQTLLVVGDGKHGMWRLQESGYIREYLKKDTVGLPAGSDVMNSGNLDIIKNSYSAFLSEESWSGYKYPEQEYTDDKTTMNWVDLPIIHPKYLGKYLSHVPIDLSFWFCTMSGPRFTHAADVWKFAATQPNANVIGPLGIRAGLDITELYTNVIRLEVLKDARSWINVGTESETDYITQQRWTTHDRLQTVNWQAVSGSNKTKLEYYMVERPFFNVPYLFVVVVFDNIDNKDHSYIRPNGEYWKHLQAYFNSSNFVPKTTVTLNPRFYMESYSNSSGSSLLPSIGTPLYGVNHPNRRASGLSGGACPMRGGDWAHYPSGNSGSGWPTQYEEITPLCDAVLVDIKYFANLAVSTWNDPKLFLGNSGKREQTISYTLDANVYGNYTDKYLVSTGQVNPHRLDMTKDGKIVPAGVKKLNSEHMDMKYLTVTEPVPYKLLPTSCNQTSCQSQSNKHLRDSLPGFMVVFAILFSSPTLYLSQ